VDAVRRIFRALRVAAQQVQARTGISAAQHFVLASLANGEASSLTELGARTHTDRTSAADVVRRLEARGLVERVPSERDRRRTRVRITDAGRTLLADAPPPPTAMLIAALDTLSEDELGALADDLQALVHRMGLEAAPAPMLFEDEAASPPRRRSRA
jgi:DNA-binding MarR family transcriptional regulator